ncbi:MAG TPA: DHH family phosphoesterase [Tepidisphaeraceae bacterium]|nr:DHH family phosphoesterase [Tepidisphaeraceae bacterium]
MQSDSDSTRVTGRRRPSDLVSRAVKETEALARADAHGRGRTTNPSARHQPTRNDPRPPGATAPRDRRPFVKAAMNTFVESCLNTVADSAAAAQRRTRHRLHAPRLLKALAGKRNILVTAHTHPDPDALASAHALTHLLTGRLKDAKVTMAIKGQVGGGLNDAFTKHLGMKLGTWDDAAIAAGAYDAIILLDVQPGFAYSPLPPGVSATAVIDHHRSRGRNPKCAFCDIRTDVGATSSIVFSYFLELRLTPPADLAAALLYAIETDLAGAAGQPGELDNIALSNLTLLADTRKHYQMRYVDLPQSFFVAISDGLLNATVYDTAVVSHLSPIDSLEKPAVIADFLLRYQPVQWSLVTARHGDRLLLSLRTSAPKASAAEMMRRLVRKIGEGGGHRTKAGGVIQLGPGATDADIDKLRALVRGRYLRALKIAKARPQRLVPKPD